MALLQKIISASNWKHASAEVALIVIGITIALWADSWVGERRDAQRETMRLTALHADTEKTLASISTVRDEASNAAIALRKILQLQPPYEPEKETFNLLRQGLLFGSIFHAEMSVYDDLKNSGELALLTDPSLRRLLSSMEAGLERWPDGESGLVEMLKDTDDFVRLWAACALKHHRVEDAQQTFERLRRSRGIVGLSARAHLESYGR